LLAPGPYPVGFRSTWVLDEGRTYRTEFDGGATWGAEKSARPLLVLQWYPALAPEASGEVRSMTHGRYLEPARDPARLAPLARTLGEHARGIFVEQVLGEPEANLDERGRAELELALAAPTPCRPDAPAAPGPFPLVLYHYGAGSSFEDNAARCENLASHGYVVLGSPFPRADGSSLGIDGGQGSAGDARFLVRWARSLPAVDWQHVGLVGHSAGAQAWLRFASQPGCVADALVLLDTTQDYYGLNMPLHEVLVREASEGRAQLTRPMLVAAGPEAMFALCDTLVNAERLYLTVPELGHDEFISQGLQRLTCLERRVNPAPEDEAEAARAPAVRAGYRDLCACVLAFLDAELKGQPGALEARLAQDRARAWSAETPYLLRVARGEDGPPAYDPASEVPPTPRQFRRLLEGEGAAGACRVLERFRDLQPPGPLYTSTMLSGSLLYGLLTQGRREEAALYYATLKSCSLPVLSLFAFLADMSGLQGKPEQALHFLRLAHELDPEDEKISDKLRQLEPEAR